MSGGATVLVLAQEPALRTELGDRLADAGFSVESTGDARAPGDGPLPHAIVAAFDAGGPEPIELIEALLADRPGLPVYCVSPRPRWQSCATALRLGARDYLEWPNEAGALVSRLDASVRSLAAVRRETARSEAAERRRRLTELMLAERGNVTRVAEALGCSRKTVYAWCRRYGVRIGD